MSDTVSITNIKYEGDLIIECNMDGEAVALLNKDWDLKRIFEVTSRTSVGALMLEALFPGALLAGAIVGGLSVLVGKPTGYYNKRGKCVRQGLLHRADLF